MGGVIDRRAPHREPLFPDDVHASSIKSTVSLLRSSTTELPIHLQPPIMQFHSESSDNVSIMSSSTITPSDYTTGSSTATLVPKSSPADSKKKNSKPKDKKGAESMPRTLRPQMVFI